MYVYVRQIFFFFFLAENRIQTFCLSRGLGDVYKGQLGGTVNLSGNANGHVTPVLWQSATKPFILCFLYTSDAADEAESVDYGLRRLATKKKLYYKI